MRADLELWEREPGESAKAYAAFREFRDRGPGRSLAGCRSVERHWSSRWHWAQRARAWDGEQYRIEDARRLEAIRTMDDTHQRAARALITEGIRALQKLPPLTPHQAARFLDLGTRLERATLLGEHLAAPPLLHGVDEELSPLERIARELAGIA